MASREFFESNAVENNAIRIEIGEANPIVLPIPENRSASNTFVQIGVGLINNTSNSFCLKPNETLIPEVLTSSGQALQGQEALDKPADRVQRNIPPQSSFRFKPIQFLSNLALSFFQSETREYDSRLVDPGQGISFTITLRLVWQNNLLQLQVINSPSYLPIIFSLLDKSWSFDALQAGTYQLRFVWGSPNDNEFRSAPETRQVMGTKKLATQFVNIRLIEPVEDNKSAVEVEGIRFETLIPEQLLNVPLTQTDAHSLVRIGISITNNTSSPVRFSLFATLIPQIVGANGQTLKGSYARLRTRRRKESDFPLVMPGESLTFFPDARLLWFERDPFILNIAAGDGGYWSFNALNLGAYQIQFTYNNKNAVVTIPVREKNDRQRIEGLWKGMVSTPFIEFCLV